MAAQIALEIYNSSTGAWDPLNKINNTWTYNWGQLGEEEHTRQFRVSNAGDKTAKAIMVRETADARGYGALSLNGSQWVTDGTPLTLGNIEPGQAVTFFARLTIPLGALQAAGLGFNLEIYNY